MCSGRDLPTGSEEAYKSEVKLPVALKGAASTAVAPFTKNEAYSFLWWSSSKMSPCTDDSCIKSCRSECGRIPPLPPVLRSLTL